MCAHQSKLGAPYSNTGSSTGPHHRLPRLRPSAGLRRPQRARACPARNGAASGRAAVRHAATSRSARNGLGNGALLDSLLDVGLLQWTLCEPAATLGSDRRPMEHQLPDRDRIIGSSRPEGPRGTSERPSRERTERSDRQVRPSRGLLDDSRPSRANPASERPSKVAASRSSDVSETTCRVQGDPGASYRTTFGTRTRNEQLIKRDQDYSKGLSEVGRLVGTVAELAGAAFGIRGSVLGQLVGKGFEKLADSIAADAADRSSAYRDGRLDDISRQVRCATSVGATLRSSKE